MVCDKEILICNDIAKEWLKAKILAVIDVC